MRVSEDGSFKPTNEMLSDAGISSEEIIDRAIKNTKQNGWLVKSLYEVLVGMGEIVPEPELHAENQLLMISNKQRFNGSSAICDPDTLDKAMEMMDASSIYIIPSSIHELLVVNTESMDPETLNHMIEHVNDFEVQMEEQLSDHAYKYDGEKLEIVNTQQHEIRRGRSL